MKHHRSAAFTLIEVLIVVAIVSIVIVGLVDMLIHYESVFKIQEATVDVDTSANQIVDQVHAAVLQANAIVASHVYLGTTYTSGTSTLVLQLPSVDSTGNIVSGSYDYIGFYATGTNVYQFTDAAAGSVRQSSTQHVSDVLSTLSFSYNNATLTSATGTTVDVITRATVSSTTVSQHLQERTYLRNL